MNWKSSSFHFFNFNLINLINKLKTNLYKRNNFPNYLLNILGSSEESSFRYLEPDAIDHDRSIDRAI